MISAVSWLYGKIINIRNSRYESGALKSESLGAPTISVGNITVGGTGKTPLVAFIAKTLADSGEKVCIISRGYKRANEKKRVLVSDGKTIFANVKEAGDEPFELAKKLIGEAIIVSDANRVSAGIWAKERFGITCFVLDDAFQHLKAKRDLNIVTIDATNPFGNQKSLPGGILREPLENLQRADLIVITRTNLLKNTEDIEKTIREFNQSCPIITARNRTTNVAKLDEHDTKEVGTDEVLKEKAVAFCALGNPENFFTQLRNEGFTIASTKKFADHHSYGKSDIDQLEEICKKHSAGVLLTTAKDAVKLTSLSFTMPCYIVESEMVFDKEKELRDLIHAVLKPRVK